MKNLAEAQNYQSHNKLIFLHIPKAAGTTLSQILSRQYDSEEIFKLQPNPYQRIAYFQSLSEAEKNKFIYFQGHISFGFHEYLPEPYSYITMIRNPIERVISNYYYLLSRPSHFLHEEVTSEKMSLLKFATCGKFVGMDNGQTRRIAGAKFENTPGTLEVEFGKCTTELLTKAQENLIKYFPVVGVAERFDESVVLMQQAFGWKNCYYVTANITKNRPRVREISAETIEAIKENNQLDLQLYDFSKKLLQEKIDKQGDDFTKQLKSFQKNNRVYGRFTRVKYWSRLKLSELKQSLVKRS
ncbi:MAG: sulfotransferase family 2 domain-containing protein [Oscillatoria sp. PMC 1068.18]|nr:sulfotransferase family 2 domain-containing protein [Oscillatoria sp. PMC 1076.18]MEC4991625.1 sulfotransferase family 2 domain-containing protein [Oscillatoria sp. PMC 1068.18]